MECTPHQRLDPAVPASAFHLLQQATTQQRHLEQQVVAHRSSRPLLILEFRKSCINRFISNTAPPHLVVRPQNPFEPPAIQCTYLPISPQPPPATRSRRFQPSRSNPAVTRSSRTLEQLRVDGNPQKGAAYAGQTRTTHDFLRSK
ncbi:hypothetical protein ACLOJK_022126 [Asimina triloba]